MTITRLTPPPPPQPEFQLTVTAEELALICAMARQVSGEGRIQHLADGLYYGIKESQVAEEEMFEDYLTPVDNVDELLAQLAKDVAEAN